MAHITSRAALVAVLLSLVAAGTAAADKYVALGDSYSSGVGTRTYYDNAGGCERSVYAYPYLLSQQRPNTQLTFAACSGATTSDVLTKQVGSLTTSTKLVSITIGGNDAGFQSVITECAKPAWASDCAGRVSTAQGFIRGTLPGRLDNVFSQIKSRAPSAKVLVLDYPRLFNGEDCNAGTFFSPDDETRLNATADLLKTTENTEAAKYAFAFRDAIPAFVGHAVCGSPEWLNGLSSPVGESYHPNRTGQSSGYLPIARSVLG